MKASKKVIELIENNYDKIYNYFLENETEIINDEEYDYEEERIELIDFLNSQFNEVNNAKSLFNVIHERSGLDSIEDYYEMILKWI